MKGSIRSLYISQTGMSEALGQSQVLAYLEGLAQRGMEIEVVSFEPAGTPPEVIARVREQMQNARIAWRPLVRSSSHRLPRKVLESGMGALHGLVAALRARPDIVHARSHFATAIGDVVASLSPGARLLFDCRGMLGDEYVDAGHWTEDRLEYRMVKAFERRAFRRADGIVVLTEALRRWLEERDILPAATPRAVIPCCVDTDRFRVDAAARDAKRRELGLEGKLVGVYSGTLGSWYLEEEMARLMGRVKRQRGERGVALLVLTKAQPDRLLAAAVREGLTPGEIIVKSVPPAAMPSWLAAGDFGVSFIKSCFSKMGSSPTKVAEYLACGMPVIVNGAVGDQRDLASERDAAVVLESFDDEELDRGARAITALASRPEAARGRATHAVAVSRFSVRGIGVDRYEALYRAMLEQRRPAERPRRANGDAAERPAASA